MNFLCIQYSSILYRLEDLKRLSFNDECRIYFLRHLLKFNFLRYDVQLYEAKYIALFPVLNLIREF